VMHFNADWSPARPIRMGEAMGAMNPLESDLD